MFFVMKEFSPFTKIGLSDRVVSLYQDRLDRYHFKIIHSYRHLYYLSSSVFIINDKKNAFHSKMDFIAFINIMNSSFFQSKSCVL